MRSQFSVVSLTLLLIDLTASNHDRDTSRKHTGNPWQNAYSAGAPGSPDLEYGEPWGEEQGSQEATPVDMVEYPSVVVGHGAGLYDQHTDNTYMGQSASSEHVHRHRTRHIHSNTRGANEHVQEPVSPSAMVPEQSTGDSLVTMDPDELADQSNCTFCAMREANKRYRMDQIRREILAKLKIERPPNITDKRLPKIPEISEWMNKFGEANPDSQLQSGGPDEPVVRIISTLNIAKQPPSNKVLQNMENVCYFEFHPDVEPGDIVSATLGVFVRAVTRETNSETMFLIYKVRNKRRGNPMVRRKRIYLNHTNTNKWHRFNVETVVKSWVRNPAHNFGLQIMVYDDQGESLAIVEPKNSTEELLKPFIELDIIPKRHDQGREKRMTSRQCTEMSATKYCCRYPVTIHFSDIGWDWILAPRSIQVNYCSGECSIGSLTSPYMHFVGQSSESEKPVVTACCIPKTLSGTRLMYFSKEDRIEVGVVNEIIVESCGCT